jgi:hypothetical protein
LPKLPQAGGQGRPLLRVVWEGSAEAPMTSIPFRFGCELSYTVSGPSAFIFNVSVVNDAFQRI